MNSLNLNSSIHAELNDQLSQIRNRNVLQKIWLLFSKISAVMILFVECLYLIYRHGLHKNPNTAENTKYVQYFSRRLAKIFNLDIQIHGQIPRQTSLWAVNHISWLDVAAVGAVARVFFLAKAEMASWPVFGTIAKGGGTLFIRRGSGDSSAVRNQIQQFLQDDIPVIFFPEATTTHGRSIKKIYPPIFAAAMASQKPIQILLLCYQNSAGQLDLLVPYTDDISITQHAWRVMQMKKSTAHVMALPPINASEFADLETLTNHIRQQMIDGLEKLQAQVGISNDQNDNALKSIALNEA